MSDWDSDYYPGEQDYIRGIRASQKQVLVELRNAFIAMNEEVREADWKRRQMEATLDTVKELNDHYGEATDRQIAAMQHLYSVLGMGEFPLTTGIEEGIYAAVLEISTNWGQPVQEDW